MTSIDPLRQLASVCLGMLLLAQTSISAQQPRNWKDVSGKFSIEAVLVSQDATTVHLKGADGRAIQVPKSRLSQTDLRYLETLPAPAPGTADSPANGVRRDAAQLQQALTARLAGPAEAGKASEPLPAFLARLKVPAYIDRRSLQRIGLTTNQKIATDVQATTLADQLDAMLEKNGMAWHRLRTVLVIRSEEQVHEKTMETFAYRLPVRRNDFTTLLKQIQQVEPASWESLGGPGSAVPLPPFVAIRHSPVVHRKLAEALKIQPMAHQYAHPFDNQVVDIQMPNGTLAQFVEQVEKQLGRKITILDAVEKLGISKSKPSITLQLEGVSATEALDLALGQINCTWLEKPAGLEITSTPDAAEKIVSQRLRVPFASAQNAAAVLNAVMKLCAPDSWQALGGAGQIQHAVGQSFTVTQSQPVMRELNQLIADLSSGKN